MKRLKIYGPWMLLLVAALMLLTACGDVDDSAPSTCYEIDIDHPSGKHPKTSKPRTAKPKAPAYRAPSTSKKRR